jgi:hypothetical protein
VLLTLDGFWPSPVVTSDGARRFLAALLANPQFGWHLICRSAATAGIGVISGRGALIGRDPQPSRDRTDR